MPHLEPPEAPVGTQNGAFLRSKNGLGMSTLAPPLGIQKLKKKPVSGPEKVKRKPWIKSEPSEDQHAHV